METTIPTVTGTIDEGQFDTGMFYRIQTLSDGNYRTTLFVKDDAGYEHYQGSKATRTEDAARGFVNRAPEYFA